jgi:hypothetical protein
MIVWSGLGFLVIVIVIGLSWLMQIVLTGILGDSGFYQRAIWPFPAALALSGIICWILGRLLNKPGEKAFINGEEVTIKNTRHSLFFIRMDYWGPILIVIAVVYAAYRIFRLGGF